MNESAFRVMRELTGEVEPTEPAQEESVRVKAGRLGGLKGGTARAKSLTPEQRSEIARNAARKRWSGSS